MCAGSGQNNFVWKRFVNQQPVGFDMTLAKCLFVSTEWVIFIFWIHQIALTEQANYLCELVHVVVAFFSQLYIFGKGVRISDFTQS